MILLYVTNPSMKEAKRIATRLLEKKLIACANFFPISSMYWWDGKIETGKEIVSLFKTTKLLERQVRKTIESMHPYTVPCIIRIDGTANPAFENWIGKETKR